MTRKMYDSVSAAGLPAGADTYAAYDDGAYNNVAAVTAKFPGKPVVRITVNPNDNEGDVLDVEAGDATVLQAPPWVVRRREAGHTWPTVYCSESLWGSVQAAFALAKVPQPLYWVAAYPGGGATVPAGAVAHQWIDHGPYDESVTLDTWPPTTPTPNPIPPPSPINTGDDMEFTTVTVEIKGGWGWCPSPANAAVVVSCTPLGPNSDSTHTPFPAFPAFQGKATQAGPNSPNGALMFGGMVANGNYTFELAYATAATVEPD